MRKVLRSACLLFSTVLLAGCGSGRGSAHYGWLRLKGDPKPAATAEYQAPADPGPATSAGDEPVAEITGGRPLPNTEHMVAPLLRRTRPAPDRMLLAPIVAAQDTDYYQARAHPMNKLAVASLPVTVIGVGLAIALQSTLLLGIAGAIGFTLALIGGRHARDHEERGRGYAMPAMIIGVVSLFLALLVVVMNL